MLFKVRQYVASDFEKVAEWWKAHRNEVILPEYLAHEGSFTVEADGVSIGFFMLLCPQLKEACHATGFVFDPGISKEVRRRAIDFLMGYMSCAVKIMGYKRVIGIVETEGMVKRHLEWGYKKLVENATVMVREV